MEIGYAIGAHDAGMSERDIALRLKHSQSTISRTINQFNIAALTARPKRPAPPGKTTVHDNRLLACRVAGCHLNQVGI